MIYDEYIKSKIKAILDAIDVIEHCSGSSISYYNQAHNIIQLAYEITYHCSTSKKGKNEN